MGCAETVRVQGPRGPINAFRVRSGLCPQRPSILVAVLVTRIVPALLDSLTLDLCQDASEECVMSDRVVGVRSLFLTVYQLSGSTMRAEGVAERLMHPRGLCRW